MEETCRPSADMAQLYQTLEREYRKDLGQMGEIIKALKFDA